MNLRFSEPCDSGYFDFDTLALSRLALTFSVSLGRRTDNLTCLTSACCGCFSRPVNVVEPMSLLTEGKYMGALIFIPNISLIIFIPHDIKVKSVDQ